MIHSRTSTNQLLAACCQAFLLLGYDQGVVRIPLLIDDLAFSLIALAYALCIQMSGLIGADNAFARQFNDPNATLQGTITSVYDVGCAGGCVIAFFLGESFGRKNMILYGGITMVLGTILLSSSFSLGQLLVGRIVTGLGNGFNSSTVAMYQSEMARPERRGMLLCLQGTTTIVGLCIAYWFDFGMSFVSSEAQWRAPVAFQAVFAVCLVLQMLYLPDTPRYVFTERAYVLFVWEQIELLIHASQLVNRQRSQRRGRRGYRKTPI